MFFLSPSFMLSTLDSKWEKEPKQKHQGRTVLSRERASGFSSTGYIEICPGRK